jgi:hypothetical protein
MTAVTLSISLSIILFNLAGFGKIAGEKKCLMKKKKEGQPLPPPTCHFFFVSVLFRKCPLLFDA